MGQNHVPSLLAFCMTSLHSVFMDVPHSSRGQSYYCGNVLLSAPTLTPLSLSLRYRQEVDNLKEENRRLKQDKTSFTQEVEGLKKDSERLQRKLEHLGKFEEECHRLQEEHSMLVTDANSLREQFESVILEKEDFEYRTHEALEALEEERDVRNMLETKLKEDSRLLPSAHPSWVSEGGSPDGEEGSHQVSLSVVSDRVDESLSTSPPSVNAISNKFHSTPYSTKKPRQTSSPPSSLLNEIQDSMRLFESDSHSKEMEALKKKVFELEEAMRIFQKEKEVLEDTISASSVRETTQLKELANAKEEFAKEICEKDRIVESLNQKVVIRDEQVGQLRNKLSTATADKTSLEIEVDGLSNEIQRLKVISGLELDKAQRECAQELTRTIEFKSKVRVLEEQLDAYVRVVEKLEGIVLSSHSELLAMTDDIKSLQKVVVTLGADSKVPTAPSSSLTPRTGEPTGGEIPYQNGQVSEETDTYYKLDLRKEKHLPIQVHAENHSLRAIIILREQLKRIRSPLEHFTKIMLERSLAHTAKHGSSSSPRPYSPENMAGAARKNTLDLEASISKWKSKYMHKAEENNNLRSIMKARATTADVAVSSLRSKLEGQARSYQTEVTKLKYQIKVLRKEKDEHLSLRNMYSKRCEDYIDEITRAKKLMERRKQEYDDVMVSLQRTIQRKLELSTELEEYKMEQERTVLIPKLLESSRV